VKLGGFRRQDFWLFDVSPDGKRVVFERVRENSDVVLIELPRSTSKSLR
jgi:hypothetical protein